MLISESRPCEARLDQESKHWWICSLARDSELSKPPVAWISTLMHRPLDDIQCSRVENHILMHAVRETGIIQMTLMFFESVGM